MKWFVGIVLKQLILTVVLMVSSVAPVLSEIDLKLATQDFPPFSYLGKSVEGTSGEGRVEGPAAEIIDTVCTEMGISYTLSLLPWRRAQYDMRQEGLYNGLFLIGKNESRLAYLYFSPPILKTQYGFFCQRGQPADLHRGF